MVAGAIASALGVNPASYPDSYSWAQFESDFDTGSLHGKFRGNGLLAYDVNALKKLAGQPEAQRFSY